MMRAKWPEGELQPGEKQLCHQVRNKGAGGEFKLRSRVISVTGDGVPEWASTTNWSVSELR